MIIWQQYSRHGEPLSSRSMTTGEDLGDAHAPRLAAMDITSELLSIAFSEILGDTGSYELLLAGLVEAIEDDA
jgi:hypothetical protein